MSEALLMVGRILVWGGIAYALLAVGAHFLSMVMIFPRPPVKYSPGPDTVELSSSDGVKIFARHWPNPDAKHTFLYLHGNYEDLGSLNEYVPALVDHGYAVFALDYRGYGHSGGASNERNVIADSILAYDYMRNTLGLSAERIVIFGYSLGSGPGVEVARQRPAAGLVLQGAFVSAYRVMTRIPLFPGDKFHNLAKVPALKLPVMVIHGTADKTVPFWHARKLYEAITARKQHLFVDGGPHTRLAEFTGQRYWEELGKFMGSL